MPQASITARAGGRELRDALGRLDRSALVILAGPSLVGSPLAEWAAHLMRPPVQDGDLTALVASPRRPACILMIDGYFGAGQAVTLTEIKETLDQGVRLYGCSSMGALRAVEAGPWGMVGLGEIFAAYRSGLRTADENVVLLHDDEYRALTVPTVNVDLLCSLLLAAGAPREECAEFGRRAALLFFGDRSHTALRRLARECFSEAAGPGARALALRHLEPARFGLWDAKRRDAEAALRAVAMGTAPRSCAGIPVPVPPSPDALLAEG